MKNFAIKQEDAHQLLENLVEQKNELLRKITNVNKLINSFQRLVSVTIEEKKES